MKKRSLDAAKGAVELGIEWFTVYAFSTENWRRPQDEVRFLLSVIADDLLTRRRDELHGLGVRIRFAGRRDWRVPKSIVRRMDETTELTRHNNDHDADRGVQLRRAGGDRGRRPRPGRRGHEGFQGRRAGVKQALLPARTCPTLTCS